MRAKPQHHKFLIGKNGDNIKKIRDSTGARIVFPSNTDEDREVITIIGKKESVEEAKAALEAVIKDIVSAYLYQEKISFSVLIRLCIIMLHICFCFRITSSKVICKLNQNTTSTLLQDVVKCSTGYLTNVEVS